MGVHISLIPFQTVYRVIVWHVFHHQFPLCLLLLYTIWSRVQWMFKLYINRAKALPGIYIKCSYHFVMKTQCFHRVKKNDNMECFAEEINEQDVHNANNTIFCDAYQKLLMAISSISINAHIAHKLFWFIYCISIIFFLDCQWFSIIFCWFVEIVGIFLIA